MEKYLESQPISGIIPPLNTDIRFSDTLDLHHISDTELPYTTVTVNGVTPMIDIDKSCNDTSQCIVLGKNASFSNHLPMHIVKYGYNPRDYSHLADKHPKVIHIHHEIDREFSWAEDNPQDSNLIKIKKSLISKPKAQYACGSCFAICMAQVFSDCLVVSGAVGWAPNVSETWLLANLPSTIQHGCGGGNPAVIAPFLEKHGALDSSCIDYSWCENDNYLCTSMSSANHFDSAKLTKRLNAKIPRKGCWFEQKRFLYKLDEGSDVFFINPGAPVNVFRNTVKTHIRDFGPCIGGFVVLKNFTSGIHTDPSLPTKGIYFEKAYYDGWLGLKWGKLSESKGLHAVAIVGWGIEDNVEYASGKRGPVPYWHCRNSWGEKWGNQKGMFKMAMYPFNKYSQFDKEVMTSVGGPVGSMVLVRATKPPEIVDSKQVEEKYRNLRRTLPDTYYKSTPEQVVEYNRKGLREPNEINPTDKLPNDVPYDLINIFAPYKKVIIAASIIGVILLLIMIYIRARRMVKQT
uniref:Papain-like proteinase n=1 Tax=Rhinella marina erythrocytic-like virus TaxID=2859906 RepID=A0A8F6UAE3_9VIRU|nr:papain-like proteinase [Rhinella marina erythrocytic-like virus]